MAWKEQIYIREAVLEDAPTLLWLIQLLAEYENEPDALKLEVTDIARDCFGEGRLFFPLVAELKSAPSTTEKQPLSGLPSEKMERNERIVGYGLYFFNYSTWVGKYVYLEDVFVREKYRNMGLGTAIMRECGKVALSKDCARMKYQVLDWNKKAIDLYKRLGGEIEPEMLTMRMYRDKINKLVTSEAGGSWKEHVTLRPAVPEDVPEIIQLIQMLADYLNESHGPKIGERELLQDGLMNGHKYYSIVVAEINNTTSESEKNTSADDGPLKTKPAKLAGFALHCFSYSTWEGRQMYLDDFFIREEYRNMGLGRALFRECAKVAVATNCARIYWHVMEMNTEGIKFYERIGGQLVREWLTVTMNKDSLTSFVCTEYIIIGCVFGKGSSQQHELIMAWRDLILLREAVVKDAPSVLWLRQLLNESGSNLSGGPVLDVEDFIADCFNDAGEFCCPLVAELKSLHSNEGEKPLTSKISSEKNEHLVGYGFYYYCYLATSGRMLYLEDVFVREKYRNMGLGTAIIRECGKIAISSGCVGMKWEVLHSNTKAINLYKKIGGKISSKLLTMRMYRDKINKLVTSEAGGSWKEHVTLRPAVPEDVPEIKQLIHLSTEFHEKCNWPMIEEKDLLRDGFHDRKNFTIMVSEINTSPTNIIANLDVKSKPPKLAGFVLYSFGYTVWDGKQIYMDNLFVREEYKSHTVGNELEEMLFQECAKVAVATNCVRIYWHVMETNTEGIKFYERIGGHVDRVCLTMTMNIDLLTNFVCTELEKDL